MALNGTDKANLGRFPRP